MFSHESDKINPVKETEKSREESNERKEKQENDPKDGNLTSL